MAPLRSLLFDGRNPGPVDPPGDVRQDGKTLALWVRPEGAPPDRGQGVMSVRSRNASVAFVGVTVLLSVVGTLLDVTTLRAVAVAVFLLVGLGMAPCLLLRSLSPMWFALLSVATSLSTTILLGFVMSTTHRWHPMAMYVAVVVVVLAILVLVAIRDRRIRTADDGSSRRTSNADRWPNALTALGLAVVAAAALVHRADPAPTGLYGVLGWTWYAGLLTVVVAAVLSFRIRANPAVPVLALAGIVVFSQALAYDAPAVMSAARHLGIVDFIRVNGGADTGSDIYQAWSGQFAGIAWLADVGGIVDPLPVATWWPVLMSPATALAVAVLASRWVSSTNRVWIAATVFALTSATLNITYFSPQSVGLFLSIVIFAVAVNRSGGAGDGPWARTAPRNGGASALEPGRGGRHADQRLVVRLVRRLPRVTGQMSAGRLAFILYLSVAMAVTHQISPYLATAALVVLALFRYVRPWWLPAVVAIPAIVWALLNRGVLTGFISLRALGRFYENVQPPAHGFAQYPQPRVIRFAFEIPALVLVVVGVVAAVYVLRVRSRPSWALLAAAASPVALIAATDYGQEGIFRVTLFAGPWLAVLVASVRWTRRRWTVPLLAAALVVMLGVNVYGQTALDWNRVIRPDAAKATLFYERTAPKGSVMLLTGTSNATPLSRTARYRDVGYESREVFGPYPSINEPYDAAGDVVRMTAALTKSRPLGTYYALVSTSIGAYDDRYGFQHYAQYLQLARAMAASRLWQPVYQGRTSTVYVLKKARAAAAH